MVTPPLQGDLARVRGEEAAVILRNYFNNSNNGIKQAFENCDKNGDKCLDVDEVIELLRRAGYSIEYGEAAGLLARFDTNGDGRLQYFEVVRMLSHDGLPAGPPSQQRPSLPEPSVPSGRGPSSHGPSSNTSELAPTPGPYEGYPTTPYEYAMAGLRPSGANAGANAGVNAGANAGANAPSPYNSPRSNAAGLEPLTDRSRLLLRQVNEVVYHQMHSLLKAFQEFDRDGDKRITIDEFVGLLRRYELEVSHEEAWRLFQLVAPEPALEGGLSYAGFVKLLAATKM